MADAATERRFRMPHTLVIVAALIVLVLALSWVVPSGSYERADRDGRQVTVPGTYQQVDKIHLGPQWLVIAPIRGFLDGALIIAFLLMIGGVFGVVQATGTIEFAIRRITAALTTRPALERLMIPVLMIVFSLGGSVFGMAEEVIPFILIFVPLALSLGYDSIVGVSIPFLGAASGFAAAFFNPFTVGVAQGLVGLPLYSGLGYRVLTWFIGTTVIIAWVMVYAARVKRRPESSPVYELDRARDLSALVPHQTVEPWTGRRVAVIAIFLISMVALVWGILDQHWFIEEIAALFLAMGLLMGAVAGLRPSVIATSFVAGAKDMVTVCLIIACGRALLIIAREGMVLDTILYASSQAIGGLPGDHGRPGDVRRPVGDQLLHPLRHGPGRADHADHGAARRPHRADPPDHGLRLPALRVHQPHPAHLRRHHGRARDGEDPVGDLGPLVPAADARPGRPEPAAAGAAGVGALGPILMRRKGGRT